MKRLFAIIYIRTICERLGIEAPAAEGESQQSSDSHDFGKFPYSETKEAEFLIANESESTMLIDTVASLATAPKAYLMLINIINNLTLI